MIFTEERIIYPQDLRDYDTLNFEPEEFKVKIEIVYYRRSDRG
jgi:hypothetical protein